MKSNTKLLWMTAAILSLGLYTSSCQDENVEVVGICPVVVSTSPAKLATNVPLNQEIIITFNGPLNPATVVPGVFALNATATKFQKGTGALPVASTTAIAGTFLYDPALFRILFTPSAPLLPGTIYTGTVNPTIKDGMGNVMQAPFVWSFSTGVLVPVVVSTDPANLALSVPLNKVIRARFNQPMKAASLNATSFTLKAGTTAVTGTVTYADSVASFTPTVPLLAGTIYTATITTSAVNMTDVALAGAFVWTFNTSVFPPTVVSTDPANLATNVALDKVIGVNFDQAMDAASINTSTFTVLNGTTTVSGLIITLGSTATFSPISPLSPGVTYTASLLTGVSSSSGVAMISAHSWTFTTLVIPPTVVSVDPLDAATNVPLNKVMSVVFSVPMDPLTITSNTLFVNNGLVSVPGTINYSGSTATFTPNAPLLLGTTYTGTVTTGVKDVAGTAINANFVWSFSTGAIPPTVQSVDPLDAAINVPTNKVISVVFSVPMDPLTITSTTLTVKNDLVSVSGAINYSGSTATFTPNAPLALGATYTGTVTTGAQNVTGTALASNFTWSFSTSAIPPTVQSVDPLDLASNVPLNKVISVVFSEPMDPLTITSTTLTVKNGLVSVAGTINYSGSTATFTPNALLTLGVTYTGTVTTGAKNVAGTAIASNFVWNFSTGAIPPTVQSVDPLNLATNVPLNKVISVVFSTPMDPLTITSTTFTVKNGLVSVPGAINYTGSTATFTPNAQLALGVTYTGTVTTGAQNVAGTAIASNFVWSFSTSAIPPTIQSVDPLNLATNVPQNKVISVVFSTPMDPLTITSTTFTVKNGLVSVPGAINYSGSTATFTPNAQLALGVTFTGTVTTGVENVAGTPIASDFIWNFSTAAIPPTVQSVDPLNLAANVPQNKVISVVFSTPMDPLTITSTTFTIKNGLVSVPGVINYSGSTATFTPNAQLALGVTYTGTVTTGVENVAGTPIASDFIWNFSTSAIPPTVQSVDPLNLATNVPQNKVISVVFSTPMDPLTITSTTFTIKNGLVSVPGVINYSGSTATFTPNAQLALGVTYTGTVTTGVENAAGTPIASNFVWNFSTSAIAPTVQSVDPLNLATNVPQNKMISVVFSTPMDPLTITSTTFTIKNGLVSVPGVINYSGSTATFTPNAQLALGVTYTGTVTTGAENAAGTPLASDFVWSFSTSAIPPTVESVDPLNLATNVALNKVISVVFSEPMDPLTITATTFTVKLGLTSVAGNISYLGSTATFTPNANLLSGNTYTGTVTTGAKNVDGTALEADFTWTFSTLAPLGPQGIDMVSVARFGIIAGVGVSNAAGFSEIRNMDVGIYPGVRSSITGFPPAIIVNGAMYASDDLVPAGTNAMLQQAQADLLAVYLYTEGAVSPAPATVAGDIGGTTLVPGIYKTTSTLLIQSGDLTLDAQGDVNATWIFQIASDFTTVGGAGGNVILAGGAQAKNVYWQTGSSATIGNNTIFKGNILALTSITMNSGATAQGRMLARNGSVVMTSTNIIEKP